MLPTRYLFLKLTVQIRNVIYWYENDTTNNCKRSAIGRPKVMLIDRTHVAQLPS
jgi:hypothetical protein